MSNPNGEPMHVKSEVTRGNIMSIVTTIVSLGTILVTVTLAYATVAAKNELQDSQIARLVVEMAETRAAAAVTNDKIATIQGDIRVIRQILEFQRGQPLPLPPVNAPAK